MEQNSDLMEEKYGLMDKVMFWLKRRMFNEWKVWFNESFQGREIRLQEVKCGKRK